MVIIRGTRLFTWLLVALLIILGGCDVSSAPGNVDSEHAGQIQQPTATPDLPTTTPELPTTTPQVPTPTPDMPTATPRPTEVTPGLHAGTSLVLEEYDGGFFTVEKPAGWSVTTAGYCSTFALKITDSANPANSIFYYNEIGPIYLAEEQKRVDSNYMAMGGYPIEWFEMPVIDPLTPENFLEKFHLVANTSFIRYFTAELPELNDVQIICSTTEQPFMPGGQTRVIRALFNSAGQLGEGLFYVTVAPVLPLSGLPGGGIGYGFCFVGTSSAKDDFRDWQKVLTQSIESLTISQSYVTNCIQQQTQQLQDALKAGKTLSETSDIIMDAWESRNRSDDILSEKWSDAILGNERVYNPDTGEVYEVESGFFNGYDIHRQGYDMDNLQLLPDDDWNLWTAPTLSGDNIH